MNKSLKRLFHLLMGWTFNHFSYGGEIPSFGTISLHFFYLLVLFNFKEIKTQAIKTYHFDKYTIFYLKSNFFFIYQNLSFQ